MKEKIPRAFVVAVGYCSAEVQPALEDCYADYSKAIAAATLAAVPLFRVYDRPALRKLAEALGVDLGRRETFQIDPDAVDRRALADMFPDVFSGELHRYDVLASGGFLFVFSMSET